MVKQTFWRSAVRALSWIKDQWIVFAIVLSLWAGFRHRRQNAYVLIFYVFVVSVALWARRKDLAESCRKRRRWSLFGGELKHDCKILLFFASLTFFLEGGFGWFQHFEYALLDTFIRGQSQTIPLDVFVVEITKQDLPSFSKCGPANNFWSIPWEPASASRGCWLDPEKVGTLIQAAEEARASVIGVDVDTCDSDSCDIDRPWAGWEEYEKTSGIGANKNIVWAEVPHPGDSVTSQPDALPLPILNCVLGHKPPEKQNSGIVRFEQENGIVRGQQAQYRVYPPVLSDECPIQEIGKVPFLFHSFHSAVIEKCLSTNSCTIKWLPFRKYFESHAEKVYLNFPAKDLQSIEASQFLAAPTLEVRNLLRNRIVLIGGTFDASDNYATPLGKMPGVELLADAIESDLNGSVIPADWWPIRLVVFGLDLLFGAVIVWIYFMFGKVPRAALAVSLIAILVALVLGGMVFYWLHIWINPIVVMAGMLIHQVYETTGRWEGSLVDATNKIRNLRRDLRAAKNTEEKVAVQTALDHLADDLVTLFEKLLHRDG